MDLAESVKGSNNNSGPITRDIRVAPGQGCATTLAWETSNNPWFRLDASKSKRSKL